MIARYALHLKMAKDFLDASEPKLKDDQGMRDFFSNSFGLPASLVRVVGAAEALLVIGHSLSFLHKNISRAAAFGTLGLLSGATYNHFKAGQGKKGAQHALDLMKLASISLLDTFVDKK